MRRARRRATEVAEVLGSTTPATAWHAGGRGGGRAARPAGQEHRTMMSAVIRKVQLAKSGLTEACSSLLTGFEVRS